MDEHDRIVGERFRLLSPAGRGGMAEVWRAEPVAQARGGSVAVKRILPDHAADDAIAALFADEARITATLSHPNIVGFLAQGADAAGPWLALEWVEGVTLRALMSAHGPLHESVVVPVALDVLRGLEAAHTGATASGVRTFGRAPVIHRDVSPSNVLVGVDGVAKLSDFGLARSLAHPRTHARGKARGKINYLAPEVLAGSPHGVRGDLYAVGVVVWEALAGRRLFANHTEDPRALRRMLSAPRESLRAVRPSLPPALTAAVDRAIAFDPAARFASARAMSSALAGAVGEAVLAAGPTAVASAVRAARAPRYDEVAELASRERPVLSDERYDEVEALLASTMRAIAEA